MRYVLNQSFCSYLARAPVFVYALPFLFGIAYAFAGFFVLPILTLLLAAVFLIDPWDKKYKTALCILLIFLIAFSYGHYYKARQGKILAQQEGVCFFHVDDVVLQKTPFKNSYVFKGKIKRLITDDGKELFNIPCKIFPPKGDKRPKAFSDFVFRASIEKTDDGRVKLEALGAWEIVKNTYSAAEIRHIAKKKFRKFLKKTIPSKKGASFLYSLSCGEIETQLLERDFSRLGLQHILAVSGFHFGIIAVFVGAIFRHLLPKTISTTLLFLVLTAYFFFLSSSPSVLRAYVTFSITLLGAVMEKKSYAINTLGLCLLIQLVIDPNALFHIGFQLSFLCTLALLIFTPIVYSWLITVFPIEHKELLQTLPISSKLSYLIMQLFRKALATSLSVHIISIPVCLYYSKSFPLFSLIYNLFFPFLIGLCMTLFLTGLILMIIPPLGAAILCYTGSLTAAFLKLTEHPPFFLEYNLTIDSLNPSFLLFYLAALFLIFSYKKQLARA